MEASIRCGVIINYFLFLILACYLPGAAGIVRPCISSPVLHNPHRRQPSWNKAPGKMMSKLNFIAVLAASLSAVSGQTFQRLGTCPTLGCILPPDQQDFLPGQQFDIRFEIHAPKNGSEAFSNGVPDEKFTATITKDGARSKPKSLAEFFKLREPSLEKWTFSWYEDLFAQDAKTPSVVNVASKIYRRVALYEPGTYTVTLKYYSGKSTEAKWTVRPLSTKKKAKNVIFFIGALLCYLLPNSIPSY